MTELVEKGKVYVLTARYKENDDEVLGVFDSKQALFAQFARCIREDHKGEDEADVTALVADLTADLVHQGDHDECVDGKTTYGLAEYAVMGVKEQ